MSESRGEGFGRGRSGRGQRSRAQGQGRRVKKSWLPAPADPDGEPQPLTDDQRQKLAERSMNLCVWHLSRGSQTRKQLHDRLTGKDVPADIIETTLNRLEEIGYLNDERFAEQYVRSRHENDKKGPRAIRQALRSKGVDDEVVAEALEAITPETEYANAMALVKKKLRSTRNLDRQKRVNRLAGMLARNGYSTGLVFQVVREALDAEGEDTLDFEEDLAG